MSNTLQIMLNRCSKEQIQICKTFPTCLLRQDFRVTVAVQAIMETVGNSERTLKQRKKKQETCLIFLAFTFHIVHFFITLGIFYLLHSLLPVEPHEAVAEVAKIGNL